MDNSSDVFSTAAAGSTVSFAQNPFNTDRGERGNSGFDYRNIFGLAFTYDLPFYKEQHGAIGRLLGGWEMNTTYRYASGQPFTVIQFAGDSTYCDSTGALSAFYDACRPIVSNPAAPLNSVGICTDPAAADCGIIDGAAFLQSGGTTVVPTTMRAVHWIQNEDNAALFFGSPFKGTPRNTLRGQPISTVNFSMYKNIKVRENLTFQFQAVAFNVLNTQYRGAPDPVLDDVGVNTPGVGPAFLSTAYNFDGGGNNLEGGGNASANLTYDGLTRRRLLFGLKLIF